jgi:hypothetical protein
MIRFIVEIAAIAIMVVLSVFAFIAIMSAVAP